MRMVKRISAILMTAMLVVSICIPVFATQNSSDSSVQHIGGATFVGTFADKLKLSVDNDWFFKADIMNPGDKYESHLTVKNTSKKSIEVSLLQIINKLKETKLLDALDLKITLSDGTIVYEGKYSSTKKPVLDWIPIGPGETIELIIEKGFPATCGNEYQNERFETEWVFEVRTKEDKTDKKDDPGKKDKTNDKDKSEKSNEKDDDIPTGDLSDPGLWVRVGCIALIVAQIGIVFVRLMKRKKRKEGVSDEG